MNEFDRNRAASFEMERRRAHSRGLVADGGPRVEPAFAAGADRYNARSANVYRQASPVREVGSRTAWRRPDVEASAAFQTANTAATKKDLRKSESIPDKKVQFK